MLFFGVTKKKITPFIGASVTKKKITPKNNRQMSKTDNLTESVKKTVKKGVMQNLSISYSSITIFCTDLKANYNI